MEFLCKLERNGGILDMWPGTAAIIAALSEIRTKYGQARALLLRNRADVSGTDLDGRITNGEKRARLKQLDAHYERMKKDLETAMTRAGILEAAQYNLTQALVHLATFENMEPTGSVNERERMAIDIARQSVQVCQRANAALRAARCYLSDGAGTENAESERVRTQAQNTIDKAATKARAMLLPRLPSGSTRAVQACVRLCVAATVAEANTLGCTIRVPTAPSAEINVPERQPARYTCKVCHRGVH